MEAPQEWRHPRDSQLNLGFSFVRPLRLRVSPSFLAMKVTYMVLMQVTGRREDCCICSDESGSSLGWLWVLQPSWVSAKVLLHSCALDEAMAKTPFMRLWDKVHN